VRRQWVHLYAAAPNQLAIQYSPGDCSSRELLLLCRESTEYRYSNRYLNYKQLCCSSVLRLPDCDCSPLSWERAEFDLGLLSLSLSSLSFLTDPKAIDK